LIFKSRLAQVFLLTCLYAILFVISYYSRISENIIISDELYFFQNPEVGINRLLWIKLAQFVTLIGGDVMALRFINLAFLVFFCAMVHVRFKNIPVLIIGFCLCYVPMIASLAIRDTLLLSLILVLLPYINGKDSFGISPTATLALIAMSLLRPFLLVIILLSKIKLNVRSLVFSTIMLVIFLYILSSLPGTRHYYDIMLNLEDYILNKMDKKGLSVPDGIGLFNVIRWLINFYFGPSPLSLFYRIFGETTYGTIDDIIRVIYKISLYGLYTFVLYFGLRKSHALYNTIKENYHLITFLVLYGFLYSIFNFGGSHERIKLIIPIVLLFIIDRRLDDKSSD